MRRLVAMAVLVAGCLGDGTGARAETLEEALTAAYLSNPQLLARRAQGRAVNESVPQALANWRPTASLSLTGTRGRYESSTSSPIEQVRTGRTGTVTVTQQLYRGGRTVAATRQAEAKVLADWAELTTIEQTVLKETVEAYLNVVREKAVLDLNINNEQVLQRQLEATRDRFRVGEITQTDVAQAEARLARATATRLGAEGTLQSNRATYERLVGAAPGALTFPPVSSRLPQSLQEATEAALSTNPDLKKAEYTAQAARHGIDLVRGALRPTVSLEGKLGRTWDQSSRDSRSESAEILLKVNVPLYQQGAAYASLRESKHTAGQRRLESDQARRTVTESVTQAWENLQSARAQIDSFRTQITAAEVALEGVKRESQVGSRTVLDVLNAEQELVDARVELVKAEHTELLNEYQLLSAVGRMTARDLALAVDVYDPAAHYHAVRNQWVGSSAEAEKDAKNLKNP